MLLGTELNNLLSRLFCVSGARTQDAYNSKAARNECSKPLMQIVESKVSQRQKVTGTKGTKRGFAAEVGPPPLTPAAIR
ncbi:MAG: hypothetical protein K2Y39_16545 [Candidatus Obscuribacterales bacterium]|nr:hypothetical protein [Candidatus Obscuribacterales bacterium]